MVASTLLLIPIQTHAATFFGDDGDINITETETNVYAAGDKVEVNADIRNDLVVAGEEVIINNSIENDLIAAGKTIQINDTVRGNLIAAGETIVVEGQVNGNTRVAGSSITLTGDFQGDVVVGSETLILDDAQILGDLVVGSSKVKIKGNTRVNGNSYASTRTEKSVIENITAGELNYEEYQEKEVSARDKVMRGAQTLIGFLIVMVTIIWVLFSKKRLWTPSVALNMNMLVHIVVGLLSFVVAGVIFIISAILSFPTGLVATLLLLLNLLVFGLSIWYIPVYVTNLASNTLEKAWPSQRPWLSVLGVWLMLVILTIIAPISGFLGVLIGLFFTIVALATHGFLLASLYRAFQAYLVEPRQRSYQRAPQMVEKVTVADDEIEEVVEKEKVAKKRKKK